VYGYGYTGGTLRANSQGMSVWPGWLVTDVRDFKFWSGAVAPQLRALHAKGIKVGGHPTPPRQLRRLPSTPFPGSCGA